MEHSVALALMRGHAEFLLITRRAVSQRIESRFLRRSGPDLLLALYLERTSWARLKTS